MITMLSSFLNKKFMIFISFAIFFGFAYYSIVSLEKELEEAKNQAKTLSNNLEVASVKSQALEANIQALESLRIKDQVSLTSLKNDAVKNQKAHAVKLSRIKQIGESNHDIKTYLNTSLPAGIDCLLDTECDTKPNGD
jgi:hypothetical protein